MTFKIATIVIPVYNRQELILRCLDSVAAQQSVGDYRLVVVDNNSTDASADVVRQWLDAHRDIDGCLLHESRPGAAAARNRGLEVVDTEYVMFFDSDDVMLPGHLAMITGAIRSDGATDVFGWDVDCKLASGRDYRAYFGARRPVSEQMLYSSFATQRFIVRTSLIREVGGWDATLMGWNDFELGVRLVLARPAIKKLGDGATSTVRVYFTPESITGRTFSASPDKWETSLNKIERDFAAKAPALLYWVAYRRAVLAGIYAREGSSDNAARLLSQAIAPRFGRLKARAVYEVTRLFGRGATLLGRLLLSTRE